MPVLYVQSGKKTAIRLIAVREIGVSRLRGDPIKGPSSYEFPRTITAVLYRIPLKSSYGPKGKIDFLKR